MLRDHCGDCYELLTDVRVLNTLANLLGGAQIRDTTAPMMRLSNTITALARTCPL
jgi:hypothetical protein